MPRVPTVRRSDLDRTLSALKAAGHEVSRVELRPGGEIVILTGEPQAAHVAADPSGLDAWRERKRALRAAQGS